MTDAILAFFRDLGRSGLDLGIALVRIAAIFAVAWGVSWIARRQIEPMMSRRSFGRNGALLIGRLLSVGAFVGALLAIVASFGANWTGILTVLSAFTVAVGLSLQDVMKNFFAGIILLVERPFQVGDRVKVRDVEGEIQGIDIRTTHIRNTRGALVHVPNSVMFTETLTNLSHFRTRRLHLSITALTMSVDEIQRRIVDSLEGVDGVRKPVPTPVIQTSSPEGIHMMISILIDENRDVQQAVMRTLIAQLGDCKIEVPEES